MFGSLLCLLFSLLSCWVPVWVSFSSFDLLRYYVAAPWVMQLCKWLEQMYVSFGINAMYSNVCTLMQTSLNKNCI